MSNMILLIEDDINSVEVLRGKYFERNFIIPIPRLHFRIID